jgi:hypothetical protein
MQIKEYKERKALKQRSSFSNCFKHNNNSIVCHQEIQPWHGSRVEIANIKHHCTTLDDLSAGRELPSQNHIPSQGLIQIHARGAIVDPAGRPRRTSLTAAAGY